MRLLLVSDTHGKLDCLNTLAEQSHADLIIHAGDFGFYNEKSLERLGIRELKLLITHSPFRDKLTYQSSREELGQLIQEYGLLGDFPEYLSGVKEFIVPVYAVWGNHDDHEVLLELRGGKRVPNLHLLDETQQYTISDSYGNPLFIYGLGGNFILNEKAFEPTFQGEGGKVQATFHQLGTLLQNVKNLKIPSIFVSHVSPGKEPILSRLLSHTHPDFWVSGHMGLSYPCVWNQFAIRNNDDVERWMSNDSIINNAKRKLTSEAQYACNLLKKPAENVHKWFYHTWNINLPDIDDGYAVLTFEEGKLSLETLGFPS